MAYFIGATRGVRWVRKTATHFKGGLMAFLSEALGMDNLLVVSYSAWITGTVEQYQKEAIRTAKAIRRESIRKARLASGHTTGGANGIVDSFNS